MTTKARSVQFVPSRVDGLPDVTEVTVHPYRLEFVTQGQQISLQLTDIAGWPRPAWL